MRIIFFGSDDFAQRHLEALFASSHEVVACVTQPDMPKDRGMRIVVPPIKECAIKNGVPVLQPTSIHEFSFEEELRAFKADLFVVIAYGRILPSDILEIPSIYCINVHGSYLPKYRGAAPINWAIINGEKETGVSIIKMNKGMDSGSILSQDKIDISVNDTSVTLRRRMIEQGIDLLLRTLEKLDVGVNGVLQDELSITYAPKLTKALGLIDWNKSAVEIRNLIRGLLPWPTAYTFAGDKMLKITSAEIVDKVKLGVKPGEVVEVVKEGIIVATGKGFLRITQVHKQAGNEMDAHSFSIGNGVEPGFIFTRKES